MRRIFRFLIVYSDQYYSKIVYAWHFHPYLLKWYLYVDIILITVNYHFNLCKYYYLLRRKIFLSSKKNIIIQHYGFSAHI